MVWGKKITPESICFGGFDVGENRQGGSLRPSIRNCRYCSGRRSCSDGWYRWKRSSFFRLRASLGETLHGILLWGKWVWRCPYIALFTKG